MAGHITASRRILVVNPNTNRAVTDLIRTSASHVLPSGTAADVVNPDGGPDVIESDVDKAHAEACVLDFLSGVNLAPYRAIVMACFDDLALERLRSRLSIPVVGTFESGLLSIRARANRIGILTTFAGAVVGIETLLDRYGTNGVGCVRAAEIGVADAASTDAPILDAIERTAREMIATASVDGILLGSGGLTGRADALSKKCGIPVIGAVEAAIGIAAVL